MPMRTFVFLVVFVCAALAVSLVGVVSALRAPPTPSTLGGMRREKGITSAVFFLVATAIVSYGALRQRYWGCRGGMVAFAVFGILFAADAIARLAASRDGAAIQMIPATVYGAFAVFLWFQRESFD